MSLFDRLLRLNTGSVPLEDFFTEIIAHLFESSPDTLFAFLEYFNLLSMSKYAHAAITTQQHYDPLVHHLTASRPDIQIDLFDELDQDIIFVESKIASEEGQEQLARYADILASLPRYRHRLLLYITRDYDEKQKHTVLRQHGAPVVQFLQMRWYQIYAFLRSRPPHTLIAEILLFMEEHRMAQSTQFSALDLLTLSGMEHALRLMDESLGEPTSSHFTRVLGLGRTRTADPSQIARYGRHLLACWLPNGRWWCGLGYFLRSVGVDDYPRIGIALEVDPKSRRRDEIVVAMQKIGQRPGWVTYNLHETRRWAGVRRERSLRDVLSEPDHLHTVQHYFQELLEELAIIKQEQPHLPWIGADVETSDVDEAEGP